MFKFTISSELFLTAFVGRGAGVLQEGLFLPFLKYAI